MRVLLLTNGLGYGGAERLVQALAEDLSAHGDAVRVVATTRGGPIQDELESAGIQTEVLGLRTSYDVRAVARLWQANLRFRPHIVHSHLAVSDIAQAAVRRLKRSGKHVITVHNPGVELSNAKRALWTPALAQADRVLAVSDAVAKSVVVPAQVLRPSLVTPQPLSSDARTEARARMGIRDARPIILFVGRLMPIKGIDVLMTAAPQVQGAHIVVVGDGPLQDSLRAPAIALGARSDVPLLLQGADIVVLPSRSEGLPQIILQAMAAERALVATRVGGTYGTRLGFYARLSGNLSSDSYAQGAFVIAPDNLSGGVDLGSTLRYRILAQGPLAFAVRGGAFLSSATNGVYAGAQAGALASVVAGPVAFTASVDMQYVLDDFDGGDLERMYRKLDKEYERANDDAEEVRDRIEAVENAAASLFNEWEEELDEYSDPDFRRRSEDQMDDARDRYDGLIAAMRRVERTMDPVLATFRDPVLFLKHNLTAQAIASLEGEVASLQPAVDRLIADMEAAIAEADAFIEVMG